MLLQLVRRLATVNCSTRGESLTREGDAEVEMSLVSVGEVMPIFDLGLR